MPRKYLIIMFSALLIGLGALLVFMPQGDRPTERVKEQGPPASNAEEKPPVSTVKANLSAQDKQELEKIVTLLRVWNASYRAQAGSIMEPAFKNRTFSDYLLRAKGIDEYFSKGTVLYLLDVYLFQKISQYSLKDEQDIQNFNELSKLYHNLDNEPDPVSVTIINRTGQPIQYDSYTIVPGGRHTSTLTNRSLGKVNIHEGAFGFANQAFYYNPALAGAKVPWDESQYSWRKTGRSSYTLEVKK